MWPLEYKAGLLLLSVLVSEAAENPYSAPIPILKDDRTQDAYGGYSFDFEFGNGIVWQESGKESEAGRLEVSIGPRLSGYGYNCLFISLLSFYLCVYLRFSYESPEGVPVEISFVADQGGGVPTPGGDHPRGSTPSLLEIRELRSFSLSESEVPLSGNGDFSFKAKDVSGPTHNLAKR
ncbi:endocuticle structural glycoprotein SgAbd-8-like [Penaeus vannamei]|uniref:endocuticle structural glycoprotein SgAbd-8-like n=1 Tax=Penaeus vannamei TaxID=6689 RepID=UPI00387F459F